MRVDTSLYVETYGHEPRGRARWRFAMDDGASEIEQADTYGFFGPYRRVSSRAAQMARRFQYRRVRLLP